MSLVLVRGKSVISNQRHLNIGWEPSATSTPLKVVPSNVNIERQSQKQFKICTDSFAVIRKLQKDCNSTNITVEDPIDKPLLKKRPRKNKSFANFDLSSSSDEDNAYEKKRPVIKLSFRKQTDSLLQNKESDGKDFKIIKNINTTYNDIISCAAGNKSDIKNLKENYNNTHRSKKKKQGVITKNLATENSNSDEENQIFDEVKGSTYDIKLDSEKKQDTKKYKAVDENVKHSSHCKFKISKSVKGSKRKQKTHSYNKGVSQTLKNFQELNFEDKIIKSKFKNIEHVVNSIKLTRSKKAQIKLETPFKKKSGDNAVTSLQIVESKVNTSHQLFSDNKGQELINILDLTSEEVSEAKESNNFLYQNENKSFISCTSFISPHPSIQRNFSKKPTDDESKARSSLKKYKSIKLLSKRQLPAANKEKQCKLESNSEIFKNSNEHIQASQSLKKNGEIDMFNEHLTKNNFEKNNFSHKKTGRKAKRNVDSKIKKKKETCALNTAYDNINYIKLSDMDANNVKSSLDSGGSVIKSYPLEEGKMTMSEKSVFKLISELSYEEDERGYSATECWNINTFKCGVFKLKINSQTNCMTLHKNNHLGGVLVKGNLRMKIGSRELDLSQGDMAFVPPLTEWQTTNIGVCESVFYYWCGRFKI